MSPEDMWDTIDPRPYGVHYFDRAGLPITMRQWTELRTVVDYMIVAKTQVADLEVSTVWLGFDHSVMGPVPLIFETMIFHLEVSHSPLIGSYHEALDDYQWRYTTEQEAIDGHQAAVVMLTAALAADKEKKT